MSEPQVNPRGLRFTDQQLRDDLAAGLKPAEIARKYGVSDAAVSKRVNRQKLTTTSAVVAPEESRRFVAHQIDVIAQLARNLERANKLQDACDRWLTDAEDEAQYDIGPRTDEVTVTYQVMVDNGERGSRILTRKAPLAALLQAVESAPGLTFHGEQFYALQGAESKHADPRELVLKTQAEARQSVALYADLLQRILDAQSLQQWREAIIEEVGKESPDCARRIAERLRRTLALGAAFAGPGGILS